MSYARFGWDDSDVYVFTSTTAIECCGCILQERKWVENPTALFGGWLEAVGEIIETSFTSNAGMIEHLEKHRAAGHVVPEDCLDRLRDPEDEKENLETWEKYKKPQA